MYITPNFPGPADQGILIKNRGNNALLNGKMPMPQKFYPSCNGSMFRNARKTYLNNEGRGYISKGIYYQSQNVLQGNYDQSQYIRLKKTNAIGKSSTKTGLTTSDFLTFRSNDQNVTRQKLRMARSGGSVAPAKKGAIQNSYKSGGRSRITGTGNRQIYV